MIPLRSWISARGLYIYSQTIRRTARYQTVAEGHLDELEAAGQPAIWTTWHGGTMMVSGYFFRRYAGNESSMRMIVPDDWRGETLAEWARISGTRAFRVSMEEESLVAARRFLKLVQEVKGGKSAYINPDGPDGPSGVTKPGLTFLAARSGAVVLPLGVYTRTRYQLRRWDSYSVPAPFSRITIYFGEPLRVTRSEDAATAGERIAAAINRAMAEAEAHH